MRVKAGSPPPIDFVMSDAEEQAVRNGYDIAMRRVIQKPEHVETASTEDVQPIDWASFRPLLAAVAVICMALLVGWRLL